MGETDTIRSLDDVRPGDLLFTRITRPLSASLLVKGGQLALGERVRLGPVSVDHVLIATETARDAVSDPGPFGSLPERWSLGVQAMPHGAEEVCLTPGKHWQPWCAWARMPEDWPGQAADAAAIARKMVEVGTPYSFGSYAMLAGYRYGVRADWLERRIDRRRPEALELERWSNGLAGRPRGGHLPAEAICSVLADQAWSLAGKPVCEGVAHQAVTPGTLALQLWKRPGVIWGGPSLL